MFLKVCKDVYIYTFATLTVYIYMVTVARPFIILLLSRLHLFFSLFSVHNKLSNFSSPHLLFPQMHTATSTQINQYRDTQTHPHTNKPTRTNQQRDRSVLDWNDRCLTKTIGACGSCLIGACGSCLIGACGSCLIGAHASCSIGA